MKQVIIILIVLLTAKIATANVGHQILKAAPTMDIQKVAKLERLILKHCRRVGVPCNIFTAILAQESMFNFRAVNKRTNDYGIGQINIRTLQSLDICKDKLTSSMEYSIEQSANVLAYFYKRYGNSESYWYGRYNIGTVKNISGQKLQNLILYINKVNRHL